MTVALPRSQMYSKAVWKDAKTVNVVASALTCPHTKLRLAAIHFLLGAHDDANTAADSDDEDAVVSNSARAEKLRASLGKDGAMTGKSKNKAKRALRRASKSVSKHKSKAQDTNGSFAAIHLLHDPQSLADSLLSLLRKVCGCLVGTGLVRHGGAGLVHATMGRRRAVDPLCRANPLCWASHGAMAGGRRRLCR